MSDQRMAEIPAPSSLTFEGAIIHPDLWLWDSWTARVGETLHLYCLALNRTARDGAPISPGERNEFAFHVRHFLSEDEAATWSDRGSVFQPGAAGDGADARNVWSGSVAPAPATASAPDRRWVFAYTGLRALSPDRPFLQTLCVAMGPSPDRFDASPACALSCPARDYDAIRAAGYYLGPRERLGDADGEEGGPILAWRDPYLFTDPSGEPQLLWSAKVGPKTPAIGRASLAWDGRGFALKTLHPPMRLPDEAALTQAEVPKIYRHEGAYLLLISACDRLYEGQPDDEVAKEQRLYIAEQPAGPWRSPAGASSRLSGLDDLFGASLIFNETSSAIGEMGALVLAPFTEKARAELQLTFAPVRRLALGMTTAAET